MSSFVAVAASLLRQCSSLVLGAIQLRSVKCSASQLTCFVLLFCLLFNLSPANSSPCVHDGCVCKHVSNKKHASCVDLKLDKLPQCYNLTNNDIDSLQEIQSINLTQNRFNELSAEFFHKSCLDNLQKIYVQQVGLKEVHDQAFSPLKNIIDLSLSLNSLRSVPSRAIDNLSRLQQLDLSFNNIRELANNSFRNLVGLNKLFLNNNELQFIDIGAFNGLAAIKIIWLSSNQLTILQPESFVHLKSLHTLYLESNPWNCNCRMQPFKRMLLLKQQELKVQDNPRCINNQLAWNNLALENFQCAPQILRNFSDTETTISEGSTLRLKCAIYIETFGDNFLDQDYLSHSHISWHWNNVLITNNSKGCDHNCKSTGGVVQQFQIQEYVREFNSRLKVKISHLELYSIMTQNSGSYICGAANNAGKDELPFQVNVIPYYSTSNNAVYASKITPAASSASDSQISSFSKNKIDSNENNDHILFGMVLGILCGIFIVLVICSIILVVYFRKHKVSHQPHELVTVDASTDNNTVDENHETNTETTEKLNTSQPEFNPLLLVNPVQKPPRLGIPDVSSIYSNPSWTMDRANFRSRYASYAETEPLYSDYYTLYRPNRQISRLDNRTFISDTASEV